MQPRSCPVAIALAGCLLGASMLATPAGAEDIWLSSIQPFTGADWDAGISMRIGAQILLEEINSNPDILPNYTLRIAWQDGKCWRGVGENIFLNNMYNEKYTDVFAPNVALADLDTDGDGTITSEDVASLNEEWTYADYGVPVGILGPGCSGAAMDITKAAYYGRMPIVSNSASRGSLSDRGTYPNFFRTIMPDSVFGGAWVATAKALGHTRISAACGESEQWGSDVTITGEAADTQGVTLEGLPFEDLGTWKGYQIGSDSSTASDEAAALLKQGAADGYIPRFVILQMYEVRVRLLMCSAYKIGFKNVIWMVTGWFTSGWWYKETDSGCTAEEVRSMAHLYISANMQQFRTDIESKLDCSTSMTAQGFQDEWLERQGATSMADLGPKPEGYTPALEAATTADAVCVYAQMLHKLLVEDGISADDLRARTPDAYAAVFAALEATDFSGVIGQVKYSVGSPNPKASVMMEQLQDVDGYRQVPFGSFLDDTLQWSGANNLYFGFPESSSSNYSIVTALPANVTHFATCTGEESLDFETNECMPCASSEVFLQSVGSCACATGYFKSSSGACEMCSPGTFSMTPGSQECDSCPVGKFVASSGQTACSDCPLAHYSAMTGQSECLHCLVGIVMDALGLDDTLVLNESDAVAVADDVAARADGDRWSTWKAVDSGGYLMSTGATSTDWCGCDEGSYLDGGVCKECTTGMSCPYMGEIILEPGYFSTAERPAWIYECMGDHDFVRCPGGPPGTCGEDRDATSPICTSCVGDLVSKASGECIECDSDGGGVAIIVLGLLILTAGLACVYHFLSNANRATEKSATAMMMIPMSLLITSVQIVGVLDAMMVEYPSPFKEWLGVTEVFVFNTGSLGLECVMPSSPVWTYCEKLVLLAFMLVMMCLIHVVHVTVLHEKKFAERKAALYCSVGAVVFSVFIAISRIIFAPFECETHPNGEMTLQMSQDVFCYDSGSHWTMLVIACFVSIIPAGFVAGVFWVLHQLPRRVGMGDTDFMKRFTFLFCRFRPGGYWYVGVLVMRNLFVSLVPIVPNASTQLVLVFLLMVPSIVITPHFLPWRNQIGNIMEEASNLVILCVLFFGSLLLPDANEQGLAVACCLLVGAMVLCLAGAACLGGIVHLRNLRGGKSTSFFLCHHKQSGAAMARLLKWKWRRATGVEDVFKGVHLHADAPGPAGSSLGTVVESDIVVAICTRDLLTSCWSMAELKIAMDKNVPTINVKYPDFAYPEHPQSHVERIKGLHELTHLGMNADSVQNVIKWMPNSPHINLPENLTRVGLTDLADSLLKVRKNGASGEVAVEWKVQVGEKDAKPRTSQQRRPSAGSKASQESTITLLVDTLNIEAFCAAVLLKEMIDSWDVGKSLRLQMLEEGEQVSRMCRQAIVVCSFGCFGTERLTKPLIHAHESGVKFVPVIIDPGFELPSRTTKNHRNTHTNDLSRAIDVVDEIFLHNELFFYPQDSTQMLDLRVREITDELFSGAGQESARQQSADIPVPEVQHPEVGDAAQPDEEAAPGEA